MNNSNINEINEKNAKINNYMAKLRELEKTLGNFMWQYNIVIGHAYNSRTTGTIGDTIYYDWIEKDGFHRLRFYEAGLVKPIYVYYDEKNCVYKINTDDIEKPSYDWYLEKIPIIIRRLE
jgi:hypothetical protein